MTSVEFEAVSIIGGVFLILLSKPFGKIIIKGQNRTWGFHYGVKDEIKAVITVKVIGVMMIIMGILDYFGFFHK
jgi:hypothetical protein